jgi:hypothetical protein
MRIVTLLGLLAAGCTATEDVRLIAELPPGTPLSDAQGVELTVSRGRCGSAEELWSTAFRPGEPADSPPVLSAGAYSLQARMLDAQCVVFAAGCVPFELPLGESELVVRTERLEPTVAGCRAVQCSAGLCTRTECPVGADPDTVALFPMDGLLDGSLVDVVGGLDAALASPAAEVEGPDGCGVGMEGNAASVATVGGDTALTLPEGSIDLYVWFPDTTPVAPVPALFYRTLEVGGPLDPFGLVWAADGRLVLRTGVAFDGVPHRGICSNEPVPRQTWVHVGVNVGPPGVELWIDGVRQAGIGRFDQTGGQPGSCDATGPADPLPPGADPWFLGGAPRDDGVSGFFGRIDQLRFASRRRDFSVFAQ